MVLINLNMTVKAVKIPASIKTKEIEVVAKEKTTEEIKTTPQILITLIVISNIIIVLIIYLFLMPKLQKKRL